MTASATSTGGPGARPVNASAEAPAFDGAAAAAPPAVEAAPLALAVDGGLDAAVVTTTWPQLPDVEPPAGNVLPHTVTGMVTPPPPAEMMAGLPKTASTIPLIMLCGLLALGGALAVRSIGTNQSTL